VKDLGYVAAIVEAVAGCRDQAALNFAGGEKSWNELLDEAARLAGGLRALGVTNGARVAVLSPNSDAMMALYLAVPWAGGVLAPLNARWSVAENLYAIRDCEPAVILVADSLIEPNARLFEQLPAGLRPIALSGPAANGWSTYLDLLAHDPAPDAGRAGDDLLALFYTGGTTGRSKGVMISHAGLLSNSRSLRAAGVARDGCRMIVVAPLFHMAAAAILTATMLAGGTALILPAFSPDTVLDAIISARATEVLFVPTMIQMVLDAPTFDPAALAGLETILYGASPMPEATLDRIMAAAPHVNFFQAYGMTEVSCAATILLPEFHRGAHRAAGRHRGAGRPIATAEIRLVDDAGIDVPAGDVGEVLVRGPGVMLGYWNQPEQTAHAVRDGWMHTGDGGRFDDHGILFIVDRMKDMIVSGGENVFSAEVENALALHPDVALSAVIGVPDERWGERVHAVIAVRPSAEVTAEAIIAHCRGLIADYKCPRSVEFRAALPLSAVGKVLKAELRAPHWAGRDRNVA
jgi:long-chain acyl-CoA synthetase